MTIPQHYYIGLDLGQRADHTAIAILELTMKSHSLDYITYAQKPTHTLTLRHQQILPQYTPYPEVTRFLKNRLTHPTLKGKSTLIVDATGPGLPFVDFLETAHPLPTNLIKLYITAAGQPHYRKGLYHVSRTHLLENLALLFQHHALKIPKHHPETPNLLHELAHINHKGHSTGGSHDDRVMALALAAWHATEAHRPKLLNLHP